MKEVKQMQVGQRTSRCDNCAGNCVEVMDTGAAVLVRDTHGAIVRYNHAEWDSFLTGVSEGRFTRTTT